MQAEVTSTKLSNLQLELIKLFSYNINEEQLMDIKNMLSGYFANKALDELDQLEKNEGWTSEIYEQWSKEHNRIAYKL